MTTRELEASHFHSIAQALVTEATNDQCEALKNLIFWRQRALKYELVQQYVVGEEISYYLEDSKTEAIGTIHHLNKLSVSIHKGNGQYEAIPIERVIGSLSKNRLAYLRTGQYGVDLVRRYDIGSPEGFAHPLSREADLNEIPPLKVHPLDTADE